MTIVSKIASVAVAAGMAVCATSAHAARTIPLSPTISGGVYTTTLTLPTTGGIYGNASSAPGSTLFTDLFTFVVPKSGFLSILLTTNSGGVASQNINFATNGAHVFGPGLVGTGLLVPRIGPNGITEIVQRTGILVQSGSYTFQNRFSSGSAGSYTAAFAFPAPEPAVWAMMIMGFGVVGASLRVRTRKVAFAA